MAEQAKKTELAEIVKHGQKFVIPEGISYDTAIELLRREKQKEEEVVVITEVVPGFVWDGALAFYKAMVELFGYANAETTYGFFGPNRPQMMAVQTGHREADVVEVPWGTFTLPGVSGSIETSSTMKDGIRALQIHAEVKRKDSELVKKLAARAREIVKQDSIYKGKAVSIRWRKEDGSRNALPEPKFLNLEKVSESQLIFSTEVQAAVTTNLFTPIEQSDMCRKLNIPLKRGVLASGPYGVGKTLISYVTAKKCVDNKWTFLHCQRADELADMVKFAHNYQPCAIFCEDIDRETSGGRTTEMDDLLNIVDGIESKNTEIVIILTTNHLENINPAMLRPGRLDAIINVLPPDAEAVEKLVRLYGGTLVPENADLREVGKQLAGNIPAVIRECVERSKLSAIKHGGSGPLTLTGEALLDAALGMRNQLDLLKKGAEKQTPNEKLAKVIGDAVVSGLDQNFPVQDRLSELA